MLTERVCVVCWRAALSACCQSTQHQGCEEQTNRSSSQRSAFLIRLWRRAVMLSNVHINTCPASSSPVNYHADRWRLAVFGNVKLSKLSLLSVSAWLARKHKLVKVCLTISCTKTISFRMTSDVWVHLFPFCFPHWLLSTPWTMHGQNTQVTNNIRNGFNHFKCLCEPYQWAGMHSSRALVWLRHPLLMLLIKPVVVLNELPKCLLWKRPAELYYSIISTRPDDFFFHVFVCHWHL